MAASWKIRIAAMFATTLAVAALALGARCMSLTLPRCSVDTLWNGGPALDVPYAQTRPEVIAKMLAMAGVGRDDYVLDLGTGDGRILIAAARDRGARGLGVDIDPVLIDQARADARATGVGDRVAFRTQDLFETPLADADVVTMFLLPEVNLRLRPRLLAELEPGARIVSHVFDMGDWRPDATGRAGGARVHGWIVPARIAGRWRLREASGRTAELRLTQQFQEVAGSVIVGEAARPIGQVELTGGRFRFTADTGAGPRPYQGVVRGDAIKGTAPDSSGVERSWQATRIE
ncbi:class I SAM-dependent methyltransferase [Sphingomonas gilva]|uniref:Class I SAM-dependent methyltransferase n=1 Tax=Sphingomonas gilva TaxID=2305907 RepID=A0A396RRM3_9SPHN|nr:class I SAM-dependent methyltransferase [Sphingomonas gilva]RHW19170.1 class I SAM-dependent methyltransferase [Sphingomonas gilva]